MHVLHILATVITTSGLPKPHTSQTIGKVLGIVFEIGASIALLMIIIGGFRYVLAKGDPNGTVQAKNTILYAIIGLFVMLTAYSIVTFVVKGVGA